jgi:hypothetical protein
MADIENDDEFSGSADAAVPAQDEDGGVYFDYIKSPYFRNIYAEGAWGGISPRGLVQFAVYSERKAIPRRTVLRVPADKDGPANQEEVIDQKPGFVREMEAMIQMDINAGVEFHRWFRAKLEELRRQIGIPDDDWKKMMDRT